MVLQKQAVEKVKKWGDLRSPRVQEEYWVSLLSADHARLFNRQFLF
jgi:hypothetical protein